VYRYFENKRDILDGRAGRLLATAVAENAADSATNLAEDREQVEHFARAFWRLFDSDPSIRVLLGQADSVDPQLTARAVVALVVGRSR
jgi:AcrR family transcriptional regulator